MDDEVLSLLGLTLECEFVLFKRLEKLDWRPLVDNEPEAVDLFNLEMHSLEDWLSDLGDLRLDKGTKLLLFLGDCETVKEKTKKLG